MDFDADADLDQSLNSNNLKAPQNGQKEKLEDQRQNTEMDIVDEEQ